MIPNRITLKECAKKVQRITLIAISLIVGGAVVWLFVSGEGAHIFDTWTAVFLLIPILIVYVLMYVFIFPFVWGWHNDRKALAYIIIFSAIFIILTAILEAGVLSLL